jgi:HEPN domain-containing protein
MDIMDIDEIESTISNIYQSTNSDQNQEIPLVLQARRFVIYSRDYLAAAQVINDARPQCILPMLQLVGHAVELSMKACIAISNVKPPHGHDLVDLSRQCVKLGFRLNRNEIAAIVHLKHHFFQDLATGTKFKMRYPTTYNEQVGGVVPRIETFLSITESLKEQVESRNASADGIT